VLWAEFLAALPVARSDSRGGCSCAATVVQVMKSDWRVRVAAC